MEFKEYLEKTQEVGFVRTVDFPIVQVEGLPSIKLEEMVLFESGQVGQVVEVKDESSSVLVFSDSEVPVETRVARTDTFAHVPVGDGILGNVIDAFGKSYYDSKPFTEGASKYPVNRDAPGIAYREIVSKPLLTGVSIVDLMVPLGKGQRELVIGDRKTGRTSFALQVLLNQAREGMVCIYGCIGKKVSDIKNIEEFISKREIFDKCVIVASRANDPLGHMFMTPYTSMAIAEYFRDQGQDVLLILDDMVTHAKCYREISLIAKKFPGRDSYPGDIFYAQSKLLERSGNFTNGSITCLPLVTTTEGDLSGYIQTNLMSMTDGHILFDPDLFSSGQRPAINQYYSVTRVGRQTQTPLRWAISRELNSFFSLYRRTLNFVHFGAEVNEGIKSTLNLGARVQRFFHQRQDFLIDVNLQMIIVCILWSGLWNDKNGEQIDVAVQKISKVYYEDENFRNKMLGLINNSSDFSVLLGNFMKDLKQYEKHI